MKNNPIYAGRLVLFCVIQIFCVSLYAHSLAKNEMLYTNTHVVGLMPQSQIHGKITDSNGVPLAGVSIIVKGTQRGTTSDFNGGYTLDVNDNQVLVFSFVGFKTQEIPVHSRNELNVIMEPEVMSLDTVEINAGYYRVKDRERTGNIGKIDAKTIEIQPVNNPLGAMQGHVSGVNIVQATGVPGGGFDIEIRGKNFINGNTQPLFIIDGVPFDVQSLEDRYISGSINSGNVSPLNAMDPTSIESIEVLKDADATAIYGSRGANGVVLITTKKGKAGTVKTTINISTSLGHVSHYLDLMNTEQYLEVRKEALENSGWDINNPGSIYSWPDLVSWSQTRYTDWQKTLIGGTAYRNYAKLSFSGGSERTQFLLGGSFQNESTVFPGNSSYKKGSIFNTINHSSSDDRFKINMSLNYTTDDNNLPRTDLTQNAYELPPNAPELYDELGNLNWENGTFDNPLAYLEEKYKVKTSNLLLNTSLSYEIFPNLHLKANLGYSKYQLDSDRILPNTSRNPIKFFFFTPQNYSNVTINASERSSWIMEPQISWGSDFGKAKINVLVGTTFQKQKTEQLTILGRGFPNNNLIYNLSAAKTVQNLTDSDSEYNYHAIFGRVNVNYDGKYIINVTGRRDGSSRFGSGKQFGNFGAIGIGWLFSEERMFKEGSVLSFGKLRASYGITGSDNIGDYKYLSTYAITGNDYNGTSILEPTGVFNPKFGWESNNKLETAIELGFFNDRILLNTSWYRNRSSNQLVGLPLAATTGFSSLTGNFDATVENSGWEFDLRILTIKNKTFNWTSTFNLSVPKNKLKSFPGLSASTFANRYIIGQPLTIARLYHSLGVDTDTGIYQFEDYNSDGEIRSTDDKEWIVDFAPKIFGGFGNTLSYKGISLNVFFQFKKQNAYNRKRSRANPGVLSNGSIELLNRWQAPGDQTDVMRASYSESAVRQVLTNYNESSGAVSDASFIRLQNIDLNYRLAPNFLMKDVDITIYLQGQNLFTITGFDGPDPEHPYYYTLPPLRQITLGLKLGF